jgi:hypothetical protein
MLWTLGTEDIHPPCYAGAGQFGAIELNTRYQRRLADFMDNFDQVPPHEEDAAGRYTRDTDIPGGSRRK